MATESDDSTGTVHRQFDPSENQPVYDVVQTVAELEGVSMEELPSTHETIDGLIDDLYSNPPVPAARAVVAFTYAGYRIKLHQNGEATFERVA